MSKVGILENIKLYVFNIIEDEYKKYLQSNKLLLLERSQLMHIIDDYYRINYDLAQKLINNVVNDFILDVN